MSERIEGGVAEALAHDSAAKHVSGEAIYIDDIPEPARTLQIYIGQSARAHARLLRVDVSKVRTAPGVVLVLTLPAVGPALSDAVARPPPSPHANGAVDRRTPRRMDLRNGWLIENFFLLNEP